MSHYSLQSVTQSAPFWMISGVATISVIGRLREMMGGTSSMHQSFKLTRLDGPQIQTLSNREVHACRSNPVDPKAMELVYALAKKLFETVELHKLQPILLPSLEMACSAVGAERATIFLSRNQGNELFAYLGIGMDANPEHPTVVPAQQSIVGEALRMGTVIVVNNVSRDERFAAKEEEVQQHRVLNVLAAPLKDPIGETFGVFETLNKSGGFTSSDQAILLPYISALSDALYPHLKILLA